MEPHIFDLVISRSFSITFPNNRLQTCYWTSRRVNIARFEFIAGLESLRIIGKLTCPLDLDLENILRLER